jgi:pimeloyl-ACP methyl ester carboxylesterase
MAKEMEQTLAQGKLVQVSSAGHMVFEDNPEDFITQIAAFLK